MREAGVRVLLVSLTAGLVRSEHGLELQPDVLLDHFPLARPPKLIVVPGGHLCASTLMADPRAHQLIEAIFGGDGFVAAMWTAFPAMASAGVPAPDRAAHFLSQGNLEIKEFVGRLINLVINDDTGE
jgi:putative intracellular protease/amidase